MIEQVRNNFTQIPNQIIDDTGISDRAKAVYIKMRRCSPDWSFSVRGLAAVLKKNPGTVSRALKELEDKGYIERFQTRDECSRFAKMEYRVLNGPHSISSDTDKPHPNDRDDNEYSCKDNTNPKNTIRKANCLTADLSAFTEYYHRALMPSEIDIWKKWQSNKIDSRLIKIAIKDNEYRRERLTLEHVDETLKDWAKKGIKTPVDANNYILESKHQNTQYKIRADSHGDLDEESISSKVNCCKTGDLILWRDDLISEARTKNSRFSYDAFCCPTDVFEYLPEDVLDMLIDLYKQNDDTERLKEAMNIKTELWKE